MNARTEYARLRKNAIARSKRLMAAGFLTPVPIFPRVRDLQSDVEISAATRAVQKWLAKETSTVKGARLAEKIKTEKRREQNREAQRRYRERLKQLTPEEKRLLTAARREGLTQIKPTTVKQYANLTNKEFGLIRAANTLGIQLDVKDVRDFADYIKYRESQRAERHKYTFDKWLEDFLEIREQNISTAEIIADFEEYKNDMARAFLEKPNDEHSREDFDEMFSAMLKRYKPKRKKG